MADETVARLLLEIFGARRDLYATASFDNNEVVYRPARAELTETVVCEHLDGRKTIGCYHLASDSRVNWLGWDVDAQNEEEARSMAAALRVRLQSLPHAVEFSGRKGYHVLVFLTEPIEAARAKEFAESIRAAAGLATSGSSHCECFPKQAELTATNPFGSLLKLPLGVHPRTGARSVFVDPEADWAELDPIPILSRRVDLLQLAILLPPSTREDRIVELLVPYWTDGQRHSVALAMAGLLGSMGWKIEPAVEVITKVCEQSGDEGLDNRLQAVRDTFRRINDRQEVAGYSMLVEILPSAVMHALIDLVSTESAEAGVHRIDEIRLRRDPPFMKVRTAESTIHADTASTGLWVRSDDGTVHYLDGQSHRLYQAVQRPGYDSTLLRLLHRRFGLNIAESFGKQTYEGLLLKVSEHAHSVTVYKRSHWDGHKLFISLGGSEVYILDGRNIELSYNGECGHIFETTAERTALVPIDQEPTGIAWKLLIEDLNLTSSSAAPATPKQQKALLWAWMLNTCYPSIAETKPLLLALGPTHSGKTTAMRRIARVLENQNTDVTEISTDKQDSLRASFANHHMLVIDNLEKSGTKWLADMLNRVSTGSVIELRELYKTNSLYRLKPECFVALTAVSLPFSEETVYSRMLILEFQQLLRMRPEHLIQAAVRERYADIWLDIFYDLNKVAKVLQNGYTSKVSTEASMRLADFELFCNILQEAGVCKEGLIGAIKAIPKQQQQTLAANSPFITVLEIWKEAVPEEAAIWHSAGELLGILQPLARSQRDDRWVWTTASGLARHLNVLETQLVVNYGCETEEATENGKTVKKYRFVER